MIEGMIAYEKKYIDIYRAIFEERCPAENGNMQKNSEHVIFVSKLESTPYSRLPDDSSQLDTYLSST